MPASFRRGETLAKLRDEVEARVVALRDELERDPQASSRRAAQAAERAAAARAERVRQAQERLRELEKAQAERDKKDRIDPKTGREKQPRASTTDADARVMRMAAGAFRPAIMCR
ncbi:MAG: hypothetical protein WDN04_25640 [Rhodospirillales bacterium]